jgi:hypothetical protein
MISTVSVLSCTTTSVTLSWTLNKFVDVTIYYSTSEPVEAKPATPSVKVSAFRLTSVVTIEDLEPDTTYYYLLIADNHFSSKTTTLTGSFKTKGT